MIGLARQAGRAFRRAPLILLACLATPSAAAAQDDATPTWWHEAAGLTPLLTAPPPPNPATICVIDTGVTPTPDLDITARWAYDGGTPDDVHATPDNPGHGTLVAHFAAGAVNGWGGAGAFPHGRISSVRVFPREGGASWQDYIRAITRCLKLDANTKVIVISIGGQEIEPGEADELEAHIERTRDRYGVSVVAAAGNGRGRVDFPGRFPAAFTVSADDVGGAACAFSAVGAEVDIAAPGCGLEQSDAMGLRWVVDGTSFAAPIVAGALAALRSHAPALSARQAEGVVMAAGMSGRPPRLNLEAAFREIGVDLTRPSPAAPSVSSRGGGAPLPTPLGVSRSGRLPPPKLRARRVPGGVVITTSNRPAAALLEVRSRKLRVARRADSLRVRTRRHSARARFVTAFRTSLWISVRWRT